MALRRLDAELTRRGLARSREHARELIDAGAVIVRGNVAGKPATQVNDFDSIVVQVDDVGHGYVSRGAVKLAGALDRFADIDVTDRLCLDAGASTGGFTEVLLRRGAAAVLAVDVGYGQLAWSLRTDERVHVYERMNVRSMNADDFPFRPTLVVADLSFISLDLVLPAMRGTATDDADFVLMVKPQFEVGKEFVGDGVIRDPRLRANAVRKIATAASALGLGTRDVVASPLPGPSGNVEFFLWLAAGEIAGDTLESMIVRAIEEGPQ
jgi:23S rRNA (cytidine1920-2'-O)/16S rRNA (cytidine1409-2'-O)-methyltransferase